MKNKYDGFPSFQEYPLDWLGNRDWRSLSLAQKGLVQAMRFECWVSGDVPANVDDLSACVGVSSSELAQILTTKVTRYFTKKGDVFVCESLDKYKSYLIDRREKLSEAGRKGGKKTQSKPGLSHPSSLDKASKLSNGKLSNGKQSYSVCEDYLDSGSIVDSLDEELSSKDPWH